MSELWQGRFRFPTRWRWPALLQSALAGLLTLGVRADAEGAVVACVSGDFGVAGGPLVASRMIVYADAVSNGFP